MNPLIEHISSWLENPHSLLAADLLQVKQLVKEYPYCAPIQYLNWMYEEERKGWVEMNELFPANYLQVQYFLQSYPSQEVNNQTNEDSIESIQVDKQKAAALSQDYFGAMELNNDEEVSAIEYFSQIASEKKKEEVENEVESVQVQEDLEHEKSLMVVMSFTEWLSYLMEKSQKRAEEEESQRALKAMWQKQKLAAALEEDEDEIPEQVFHMAVNSIRQEEELISESMAKIYEIQGKKDKAIEIYKKLILQIPEKSTYFAEKIDNLNEN